jgi:hypothetical protein
MAELKNNQETNLSGDLNGLYDAAEETALVNVKL